MNAPFDNEKLGRLLGALVVAGVIQAPPLINPDGQVLTNPADRLRFQYSHGLEQARNHSQANL